MAYQLKDLATSADIGQPGALPAELQGLSAEALADLSWTAGRLEGDPFAGRGYVWVSPPPPPPPRRQLAKSAVQERVNAVGKLGAVFTYLNANPLMFGRWFAPDWPRVYADDAGLLQALQAAGCTAPEIATITAA